MFARADFNRRHRVLAYGYIGRVGYSGVRPARLVRFLPCGDLAWVTSTFIVWAEFVYVATWPFRIQAPIAPSSALPERG